MIALFENYTQIITTFREFTEQTSPNELENEEEEKKEEKVEIESNWDKSVQKFDNLDLKEDLLRGIYGYGFTKPSPI